MGDIKLSAYKILEDICQVSQLRTRAILQHFVAPVAGEIGTKVYYMILWKYDYNFYTTSTFC